eukprot:GILK01009688.1.p1 GENE.GILK01009688.1~~GILK01009688.1.p1  ORF type:complete len:504 (-),score=83.58 GILK01009688.1:92-1603(-)
MGNVNEKAPARHGDKKATGKNGSKDVGKKSKNGKQNEPDKNEPKTEEQELKDEIARVRKELADLNSDKKERTKTLQMQQSRLDKQRAIILQLKADLFTLEQKYRAMDFTDDETRDPVKGQQALLTELQKQGDAENNVLERLARQIQIALSRRQKMKAGGIYYLVLTLEPEGPAESRPRNAVVNRSVVADYFHVRVSKDDSTLIFSNPMTQAVIRELRTNMIKCLIYGPTIRANVTHPGNDSVSPVELSAISFTLVHRAGTIDFLGNTKEEMVQWFLGIQDVAYRKSDMLITCKRLTFGELMFAYIRRRLDSVSHKTGIRRSDLIIHAVNKARALKAGEPIPPLPPPKPRKLVLPFSSAPIVLALKSRWGRKSQDPKKLAAASAAVAAQRIADARKQAQPNTLPLPANKGRPRHNSADTEDDNSNKKTNSKGAAAAAAAVAKLKKANQAAGSGTAGKYQVKDVANDKLAALNSNKDTKDRHTKATTKPVKRGSTDSSTKKTTPR